MWYPPWCVGVIGDDLLKAPKPINPGGISDAKSLVVGDDKGFSRAECVLGVEFEIEGVGVSVVVISRCIGDVRNCCAVEADALSEVSDGALIVVAETMAAAAEKRSSILLLAVNAAVLSREIRRPVLAAPGGSSSTPVIIPGCSLPSTQMWKAC